jgi:rRNA maturation endonuclease Nob1
MSLANLLYCAQLGKMKGEDRAFSETAQRMLNGKSITLVQVCLRCKREFPCNKRRRLCPVCAGILRTKITILKAS